MSEAEEMMRKMGIPVPENLTESQKLGKLATDRAEAMLEKIREGRKENP